MRRTLAVFSLCVLVVLLLPAIVKAQSFRNVNVQEGLCNSVVKCFSQDRDGVVWMGTFKAGITDFITIFTDIATFKIGF